MCADIFISYAREDRATAQGLADAFTESGWDVWWDREIQGGTAFATEIERALLSSRVVVVLWSLAAVGSDFVRDEARRAMRAGKLLPIRIEEVEPPLGFGETHTLDLLGWDGDRHSSALLELSRQLRQRLEGRADPLTRPESARGWVTRRRGYWAGGLVGALIALALGIWLLSQQTPHRSNCAPPGGNPEWKELREGWQLLQESDLEPARALFNKILAAEPRFARARFYLAQVLIQTGEGEVAHSMLKELFAQLAGRTDCALDAGELKKIEQWLAELQPTADEPEVLTPRADKPTPPDQPVTPAGEPVPGTPASGEEPGRSDFPVSAPAAGGEIPAPKPSVTPRARVAPDARIEQQLRSAVDATFGGDGERRVAATTGLIADPEAVSDAVPLALRKAQAIAAQDATPSPDERSGVINALVLLQSATPATLNAHRAEIEALLQSLRERGGSRTAAQVERVAARLDGALNRKPVAYIQIADEKQRPFADALAAKLRRAGYQVPAFENVGGRAPQEATEIRIQGRSDRELARWMAQALAKSGAGEVRSRTLRKAQSGNDVFEIWLDQTLCMPDGKQAPSCAGSSGGH